MRFQRIGTAPVKRECCACGRLVMDYGEFSSSKARRRHKCPHGIWCISGRMGKNGHGFNHNTFCPECVRWGSERDEQRRQQREDKCRSTESRQEFQS